MIKLFRRLFTSKRFDQDDYALVEGEFLWCIVGNIVGNHFYGEQKEIKSGTKHFRPGAKVYCIPEYGGMGHETIRVIGKPRGSRGLINVVIQTKRIKNFRLQKVYSDSLFEKISELPLYRVNNSYRLSKKELGDVLDIIKTYSEEFNYHKNDTHNTV
jgi:hypothetical protein